MLIQEAAEKIEIDYGNEPIVIADYSSSQGKTSWKPIWAIIESLRGRVGGNRPIVVCHIDLPLNDFNSLFKTPDSDANSYTHFAANVYSCAVGRSFFENVLRLGVSTLGGARMSSNG